MVNMEFNANNLSVIKDNNINHAYLFDVDDDNIEGIYLPLIKQILKIEINDNEILNQKLNELDNGTFSDLKIVESNGAVIKKEQISDLLDEYKKTSIIGTSRFYVIKYAENMNASAANSLLKFLEEPDGDIIAILFTKNKYSVLETILSRCCIFNIKDKNDIIIDSSTLEDAKKYLDIIIKKGNKSIAYLNDLYLLKPDELKITFDLWLKVCQSMLLGECTDIKKVIFLMNKINDGILKLNYNINTKVIIDNVVLGGDNND